jgi:GH24 family phage-related lysozyme (muramidase)
LEGPYQNALTSLAYNVGGGKAGRTWTNVLTAAKNKDVSAFAAGLRRKDAGRNTEGMDNRVAKELYYAGLIDSLADVKAQLPLATSRSGVPLTKE